MAANSTRHILLFLLMTFACMPVEISFAVDAPVGKVATCGSYTYMPPETFAELHFHRAFNEFLPISELNDELSDTWRSATVCITVENKAGNEFIIGQVVGLITGSQRQKNPLRIYPKQYKAELPDDIRLYTFENQYNSEIEMDFSQYLIELKALENEDNVLLYILDETFHPISKDDPRTLEQVEADKNKPRKERAMQLINSVRRLNK